MALPRLRAQRSTGIPGSGCRRAFRREIKWPGRYGRNLLCRRRCGSAGPAGGDGAGGHRLQRSTTYNFRNRIASALRPVGTARRLNGTFAMRPAPRNLIVRWLRSMPPAPLCRTGCGSVSRARLLLLARLLLASPLLRLRLDWPAAGRRISGEGRAADVVEMKRPNLL